MPSSANANGRQVQTDALLSIEDRDGTIKVVIDSVGQLGDAARTVRACVSLGLLAEVLDASGLGLWWRRRYSVLCGERTHDVMIEASLVLIWWVLGFGERMREGLLPAMVAVARAGVGANNGGGRGDFRIFMIHSR